MSPLTALLSAADRPLVLHDAASAPAAVDLVPGGDVVALDALPAEGAWDAVVLVVTDRSSLRSAAGRLPALPAVTAVGCLLTHDAVPLALGARPGWPEVVELDTLRLPSGRSVTAVHLSGGVAADLVLRELARLSVPARFEPLPGPPGTGQHLDPAALNPIGFRPDASEAVVELRDDGEVLSLDVAGVRHDLTGGATSSVVEALRDRRGVRVGWDHPTPALARAVTGLAMAGTPLVGHPPPATAVAWLGTGLHQALTEASGREGDLLDPLRREELSIPLRRAALTLHGPRATVAHGDRRFPDCTVVLATRRPEQLEFAVRQVARQRGPGVELVVVGHGFEPDLAQVRETLGDGPCQVLSRPTTTRFGDVLDAGVDAASGEVVVKMDDDDWYGPHFLLDLLLAREYSGAEVVGAPDEFVYVHQVDRTVRTRAGGEQFARIVAGGTIAVDRGVLRDLGGYRSVHRFVDRQLLDAASSVGLRVYRGHGLGYLLRRTPSGHTWDPGLDFFLGPERVTQQWKGFVPTAVHDVAALDAPAAGDRGVAR